MSFSTAARRPHRFALPILWLAVVVLLVLLPRAARADLKQYIAKPDSSYRWEYVGKELGSKATLHKLKLTSQTWKDIVWQHEIVVYQPEGVAIGATMALYNTGGAPTAGTNLLGLELARRSGVVVAILYGVPNQPLLDGKSEDALIAETFVRYLKTGDEELPLLFPMAKSVVRAMDALQAWAKDKESKTVTKFIIGGASKRGWTAWLVGASGDTRVQAIFPMVIDTLNMPKQVTHQKASYGGTSAQIDDYKKAGLTDIFTDSKGKRLTGLVDPYAYRAAFTMPKLLVLGANDPYWTADSLQLYIDALPGDTFVSYSPNAGHNLTIKRADGTTSFERPLRVIAAFLKAQAQNKLLPRLVDRTERISTDSENRKAYKLTLRFNKQPIELKLWVAKSKTRDFRQAVWEEEAISMTLAENAPLVISLSLPADGFLACFAEADFGAGNELFSLCAPVRVLDKDGMVLPR